MGSIYNVFQCFPSKVLNIFLISEVASILSDLCGVFSESGEFMKSTNVGTLLVSMGDIQCKFAVANDCYELLSASSQFVLSFVNMFSFHEKIVVIDTFLCFSHVSVKNHSLGLQSVLVTKYSKLS